MGTDALVFNNVIVRLTTGMYSIHIIGIPDGSCYNHFHSMAISFTQAEQVAMLRIGEILHKRYISMIISEQNVYDVYSDNRWVGHCVINAI